MTPIFELPDEHIPPTSNLRNVNERLQDCVLKPTRGDDTDAFYPLVKVHS